MLDRRALIALLLGCNSEQINPLDAGVMIDMDSGVVEDAGREVKVYPDAPPPAESGILVNGPAVLSQTGLYSDFAKRTLAPGVTAFAPRWSLWSDGLDKSRWILLPQGQQIDTSTMDQWTFPVGTKIWKEFRVGPNAVETRFLWKVQNGGWKYWWMGAYLWRMDGTDADYVKQGQKNALGTTHDVPSQVDCVRCHDGVRDVGIGFSAIQLSAPQNSQLAQFAAAGAFTNKPAQEWDAPGTGNEHDALAYMHANCGHCHNEESWLYSQQTTLVLRLRTSDTAPDKTGAYVAIGMKVKHWGTGVWGDYAIVAGKPDQSQSWLRMNVRDDGIWQMPPVCTKVIDQTGVKAVGTWIASLPSPDQ